MRWLNIAPSDANRIYVLASIKYYDQGILLRSADGGNSWEVSGSTMDGEGVCLAVDPHDPDLLYLGSWHGAWYGGMYRSTDGGSTWQTITTGLPATSGVFRSIAIDPTDPQRIYAGMNGQVFGSNNGGGRWHQIGNTLTTVEAHDLLRIAVDPTDPDNLYAAVWGEGVYKLERSLGYDVHLPVVVRE